MKPADDFAQSGLPDNSEIALTSLKTPVSRHYQGNSKPQIRSFTSILRSCPRKQWIAESAYFIAEHRGFLPGHALDDWLKAEKLYFEMLVNSFFEFAREDGEITLTGLRQLACAVGVKNSAKLYEKAQLINAIQSACGSEPCYKTESKDNCQKRLECPWEPECQKLIARWQRK